MSSVLRYMGRISWIIIIILLASALYSGNKSFNQLMNMAVEATKNQDWEKLVKVSEEMVNENPGNVWANYFMGLSLMKTGKFKSAEKFLLEGIKIDKNNFWCSLVLFYNYYMQFDKKTLTQAKAVNKLITEKLIKENPSEIRNFYFIVANYFYQINEPQSAIDIIKKGLALFPKDPMLNATYASIFLKTDKKKWEKLARGTLALVPEKQQKAYYTYQFPLKGENFKVLQGNNETQSHLGLLNGYHWDFVVIDDKGSFFSNYSRNEDHYIFDYPVYAAADGKVIYVHDKTPDIPPGQNNELQANIIIIEHKDLERTQYVHLKYESALIKAGDLVKKGQIIARVGNNGIYKSVPHLHFGINRDWMAVETRLEGLLIKRNNKWEQVPPYKPEKDDILKSGW